MKTKDSVPLPFFVSIPHSGEKIPEECLWLKNLKEEVLMCDVDRYVDQLYMPALSELHIPLVKTEWHRYAADMNRVPEDVDAGSVQGHKNPVGKHRRGFHWQITTKKDVLMPAPITPEQHQNLVKLIYEPFHESLRNQYKFFRNQEVKNVFHLDAHSMPSLGTSEHNDPGQTRVDIVVSDCKGQSSCPAFVDLVIAAYVKAGFKVGYNWPYFGGKVSEQYGDPKRGQHALQVEMSRALYMDEVTKKIRPEHVKVQQQVLAALSYIQKNLPDIKIE